MSVDERLRAGLERNATALVPAGEARLVAVHRRHRRRLAAITIGGVGATAATVAVVLGLASGGVDRAVPPEPSPPVATSPPSPAEEVAGLIPDSTWRRVITTEQAETAGVPRVRIREDIGADGRLPVELRLEGDTFTQAGDYGGSVWEIGDSGTVAYDERGRLVVTSLQCASCAALTITWRIDAGRLVLTRLGASNGPMERVIWTGTWRRTD